MGKSYIKKQDDFSRREDLYSAIQRECAFFMPCEVGLLNATFFIS